MSLAQTNATGRRLYDKWKDVIARAQHIFQLTGDGELAFLAEQASLANNAIEQGVYLGSSAFVQLSANPHLHMWLVDPFMVAGTQKCAQYFLRDFIAEGRCEVIPKFTKDAAAQLQHVRGKIDYVFIDGAHDKANVMIDIDCWKPLVRPGGLLTGHDFEPPNEVSQAVRAKLPGHYSPVPNMWAYIC